MQLLLSALTMSGPSGRRSSTITAPKVLTALLYFTLLGMLMWLAFIVDAWVSQPGW